MLYYMVYGFPYCICVCPAVPLPLNINGVPVLRIIICYTENGCGLPCVANDLLAVSIRCVMSDE